ncbi:heat shock protein 30 [Cadophora sp. MPI-SDFR-AT-0126]|nr:heat shock protein 30 [Leotiomycetes sp. MPI-SDFR-AT-0126]
MNVLIARTNDALNINPPVGDFHLVVNGSDWLWAVTAVYALSLLVVIVLTYFAKAGEKIFHYLFTISLFVGAISYFAMASDLGSTPVLTSVQDKGLRQIFYVRYINWFVGWTPLILAVGLVSGVSWATIIFNVALTWIILNSTALTLLKWVASWLSGALVDTTYKWGFFVFGTFAYFLVSASLLTSGLTTARRLNITKSYLSIAGYLVFFWFLYPIAWGVDDGGNVISVTSGFIYIGILDLFTVPFFAFVVLFLTTRLEYRDLNLYFTQYGRVPPTEYPEGPAGGKVNPTTTPAMAEPEAPAPAHTSETV